MIATLAALAAISGNGGLTNTALSGYTRDQGWGMGKLRRCDSQRHRRAKLQALARRHGVSDHARIARGGFAAGIDSSSAINLRSGCRPASLASRCPACSPCSSCPAAREVEKQLGRRRHDRRRLEPVPSSRSSPSIFWHMTLFCGFLCLAPAAVSTIDGALRRWVDLCWTAVPFVREWEPHKIRFLYFGALCAYAAFGVTALTLWDPRQLLGVGDEYLQLRARLQLLPRARGESHLVAARNPSQLVHSHRLWRWAACSLPRWQWSRR